MSPLPAAGPDVRSLLAEGVARGIIDAAQAAALEAMATAPAPDAPAEDEQLRLVTGFADIFVTLGVVLFLGAAAWLANTVGGVVLAAATTAGLAWVLAEFFTRRRRMALPSIALLLAFGGSAFVAIGGTNLGVLGSARPGGAGGVLLSAVAALATAGLVALHYRRFRVPITVAAGVAALLGAALFLVAGLAPGVFEANLPILLVLAGLAAFAVAMRFDLSDRRRLTRRGDIAFWLHLLAAPLIVHPLLSGLAARGATPSVSQAAAVLAVFLGLAVVALAVDRRALLVSGLVYAGIAFARLVREAGIGDRTLPLTVLALGAFVLLVSAGWRPLRALLLGLLPPALAGRLPQPSGQP